MMCGVEGDVGGGREECGMGTVSVEEGVLVPGKSAKREMCEE